MSHSDGGKGSGRRKEDASKVRDNWDLIFKPKKEQTMMNEDPQERSDEDYEERSDEDDEYAICTWCSGSGEGMYDGSSCRHCGGTGVEPSSKEDDDDYYYD